MSVDRTRNVAINISILIIMTIFFTLTIGSVFGLFQIIAMGPRAIARRFTEDGPEMYPWVIFSFILGFLGAVLLWIIGLLIAGFVLTHLPR